MTDAINWRHISEQVDWAPWELSSFNDFQQKWQLCHDGDRKAE